MIALLGSLLGFLSSSVPHLFSMWQDHSDKTHELAIMDRQAAQQLAMQKEDSQAKLAEIQVQRDIVDITKTHEPQQITGDWIIDFLSGSVRPILTYLFMIGYLTHKYGQWVILQNMHVADSWSLVIQLWGDEDMAIFATVICYWFGGRGLGKVLGSK